MTQRNYLIRDPTLGDHQQMERKEEVKFGGAAVSLSADLSCLQGGGGAELATLEKQLICPICLELFNKPVVILPCQHNLCRKCANELYQPSLFQARTTMMVNSGRFRCPSCRHEVVLDRHGVYGLQRNLLVENIIDVYKQEVSNNNNATGTQQAPIDVTCSDHEGEKVNIYCLTCQVPTCSLCKVFGAHQSCEVAPLTDIYQQHKDELSEEISSLVSVNTKVQALIDELEESCRNIEENSETQKQNVCDRFNRVFSILEERRNAMTQRISSEQEEKTGHAQALVRCYGDSIQANTKLVERATSSMEEPDMAAFVQNSRELITKVIAATGSCPSETLKPGYESLSHYRYNFSRQERALKSVDFLSVVEDVPEEPEVEEEPEEPNELPVQIIEAKHHQETSTQNLDSVIEPVKEPIPAPIPPPVTPVQTSAPTPAPVPPAPDLVTDSEEPAVAVLQPETDNNLDLNDGGSGQINKKEEEKKEEDGCAAPAPIKEENICEHEEGMSTIQCDGGEAESDAGDWTTQTEEKHDAQDEEMQMKEENDATFYPSWYKPNSWRRVSPVPAEILPTVYDTDQMMCSPQPAGDPLPETETRIQPQSLWSLASQPPPGTQQLPLSTELHAQTSENQLRPSSLLHEPHKVPVEPGSPQVTETAGEAGIMEEENEDEEDMQGWVCVPGTVDKGFSLAEGSFDLGEDSLNSISDKYDSPSSLPPEETRSGLEKDNSEMDKANFELRHGRADDSEDKKQHDDILDFEAEMMNERLRKEKVVVSMSENSSEPKNGTLDEEDHGVGSTDSFIQTGGGPEFEAGCHSALLPVGLPGHPAEGLGLHRLLHLHITPTGDTPHPHCCTAQMETETGSPAQTSPPSSCSSFTPSEAPRRPSFCFSWLNPLHKKK
ncbi:Tripartite motif-containing protein 55 Muscle-specific RING finger protein 2 [Larimichthys crocea]|uniref:RING-type E3 ubiquitin transferase n=1 Tax=Larimichthys crocea TaxID=215358 RepID=A0A6G0IMR1_LARCR|nr:Tripartite motif-containing protein 55 Muscle-specific RING finger protein 2 [Larimichthys crocea]